jgi:hypothetical protein
MIPGQVPQGKHAAAQESTMRRDRHHCRRYPGISRYTQRIVPGEMPILDPRGTQVVVEQLASGTRARTFIEGRRP